MTHSDSITLLLDLKSSDLTLPLDNFVKEGVSKLTGTNKALIFKELTSPNKRYTIWPSASRLIIDQGGSVAKFENQTSPL